MNFHVVDGPIRYGGRCDRIQFRFHCIWAISVYFQRQWGATLGSKHLQEDDVVSKIFIEFASRAGASRMGRHHSTAHRSAARS